MYRTASVTLASDERRRVTPRSTSESAKMKKMYEKRNVVRSPPRKPQRTFEENRISTENLSNGSRKWASADSLYVEETARYSNHDMASRLERDFVKGQYWFDTDEGVVLFINPFDNLAGDHHTYISPPAIRGFVEESVQHEQFNIVIRGESGSGKSHIAECLFLESCTKGGNDRIGKIAYSAMTALRPLIRYHNVHNAMSSLTELSFQVVRDQGKLTRSTISRSGISFVQGTPLVFGLIENQMTVYEKTRYRINQLAISSIDPLILGSGITLQKFRCALSELSLPIVEVECILSACLLIRSLSVKDTEKRRDCIEMVNDHNNNNAVVEAATLLGVSPHHLATILKSSAVADINNSPTASFVSILMENLVDKIISSANSRMDQGKRKGHFSPIGSDSSSTDSGIEVFNGRKSYTTTIEVIGSSTFNDISPNLRRHLNISMQSLFSQSNCRSAFALSLFSSSTPPLRINSRFSNYNRYMTHIIHCLKSNDHSEYRQTSSENLRKQLEKSRHRIVQDQPLTPMKDY